ncbi:hypothetical protein ACIBF1_14970 [Spirillospora sp. NPDC050679]
MLDSLIRTVVPLVVGVLLAQAAKIGFDLPEGAVTEVAAAVVTAAYYLAARLVERRSARAGRVLLGLGLARRTPVYRDPRGGAAPAGPAGGAS